MIVGIDSNFKGSRVTILSFGDRSFTNILRLSFVLCYIEHDRSDNSLLEECIFTCLIRLSLRTFTHQMCMLYNIRSKIRRVMILCVVTVCQQWNGYNNYILSEHTLKHPDVISIL